MLLKDLINEVNYTDIEKSLFELYPDQKSNIKAGGYKKVFNDLQNIEPFEEDKMIIIIEKTKSLIDDDEYWSVCGKYFDNEQNYSLSLIPWQEWLSMHINRKSLKEQGKEAFVAHCLWEMTWHGFDEQDVVNTGNDLRQQIKEIEDGTAELIPWEEIKKELGLDEED